MKFFLAASVLLASLSAASAQYYGTRSQGYGSNPNSHYVAPSVTREGDFRPGHYRTNPNSTQYDNYSTRGNQNPYTGRSGTRTPRW